MKPTDDIKALAREAGVDIKDAIASGCDEEQFILNEVHRNFMKKMEVSLQDRQLLSIIGFNIKNWAAIPIPMLSSTLRRYGCGWVFHEKVFVSANPTKVKDVANVIKKIFGFDFRKFKEWKFIEKRLECIEG